MEDLKFNPIELSYVVPVYFDQENQDSVHELMRRYENYPPELMDRIQFVIVDDGSPAQVNIPENIDLNILLLRIHENIKWNQPGARNLGVVYSRSDKVLATDLDHQFPEETLQHIIGMPELKRKMYRLHRRDADGILLSPHPNSFVMSRSRYLGLYGVDEEFSGSYGYDDGMFWRWQRYNGTLFKFLNKRYFCQVRNIDLDKSYHSLERDKKQNKRLKERKLKEWRVWGPVGGHSRRFLSFTWEIVEDRKRSLISWKPPINTKWKKTWFLRRLFG